MPKLLARELRHALRERRTLRIAIQESERRRRGFQLAVRMIEQHLGKAPACLVQPACGRWRIEKRRDVFRHLDSYSHSSISAADCRRSEGALASILLSNAW